MGAGRKKVLEKGLQLETPHEQLTQINPDESPINIQCLRIAGGHRPSAKWLLDLRNPR